MEIEGVHLLYVVFKIYLDIFDRIQTHMATSKSDSFKNEHDASYLLTGDFILAFQIPTINSSSHVPLSDDYDEVVTLPVRSSQDKKIT